MNNYTKSSCRFSHQDVTSICNLKYCCALPHPQTVCTASPFTVCPHTRANITRASTCYLLPNCSIPSMQPSTLYTELERPRPRRRRISIEPFQLIPFTHTLTTTTILVPASTPTTSACVVCVCVCSCVASSLRFASRAWSPGYFMRRGRERALVLGLNASTPALTFDTVGVHSAHCKIAWTWRVATATWCGAQPKRRVHV